MGGHPLPMRAPAPSSPAARVPVPRASCMARPWATDTPGYLTGSSGSTSRSTSGQPLDRVSGWRRHGLSVVAIAIASLLVTGSLGARPSLAAVSPLAPDDGGVAFAADGDPTPTDPTPTPSPTPSPTPRPTPTPWPTPPGVKGLDVSHWNGHPDFARLRDLGMRFVISKASQGTSFVDDTYARHTRDARAAGMLVGAYHFFDYRKGGLKQAQHFLSTLRATTGLGSLLPLAVDVETLKSLGKPAPAQARTRLHALLDELYRQTGRYPMIYTSRYMWEQVVGAPTGFGGYPLWVACWSCNTMHLPRGWSDWLFWQVGQFKFPGGPTLDGNVYAASASKLGFERQRPVKLDGGAAWTASRSVVADLRGYDGKDVRVAVGSGSFGAWKPYQPSFELTLDKTQGRQDVRLQLRSFRNVTTTILREDINVDTVPPAVNGPQVSIQQGKRIQQKAARVPASAKMQASDKTSGLASSTLKASCGGTVRASAYRKASSADLTVQLDRAGCTVRGIADDNVGHRRVNALQPRVAVLDARARGGAFRFSGDWKTTRKADALGKTLTMSGTKGATARVAFDGAQFAIVARRGPSGGRLDVILDGKKVGTVDLYAKSNDPRRIVFVRDVPRGKHVLKLRATGTAASASKGTHVWLDALLVLDRRK